MIKKTTLASLLALTACAQTAYAATILNENHPNKVNDRYIVTFKDQTSTSSDVTYKRSKQDLQNKYKVKFKSEFDKLLKGAVVELTAAEAAKLAKDPQIASIEADIRLELQGVQTPTPSWGLDRIDQSSLPLLSRYTYPDTPRSPIYVIDSGLYVSHTDFSGRIGQGATFITQNPSIPGGPPLKIESTVDDCKNHATNVAAIAAGTKFGVAKNALIHPIKIFDCNGNGGTISDLIEALEWVKTHASSSGYKSAVVNISLGTSISDSSVTTAIKNLNSVNILVVASAGNTANNVCSFPASLSTNASVPNVISVASSKSNDLMATTSTYGSCVSLVAPGEQVKTAGISGITAEKIVSGTSMAAPHVSGAAALYQALNPNATPSQVKAALINNSTNDKLTLTSAQTSADTPNKLLNMSFIKGGSGSSLPTAPTSINVRLDYCYGYNGVSISPVSGATSYQLFSVSGTSSTNGTLIEVSSYPTMEISVPFTTYIKAKACNANGCSAMSTAYAQARYYNYCY
ncbi:S8 family peptidase [Rheinheimera fenheensis]|uniref:S8 family peptidase n=1 Tax=Rheinheimera fenheensis TaxID=3152295 RepID=UPI00325D9E9C